MTRTMGAMVYNSIMDISNPTTKVSSEETCSYVRVRKSSNTSTKFLHYYVVRIGDAKEIGDANIYTSKMGIVGVSTMKNVSILLSITTKNGSP